MLELKPQRRLAFSNVFGSHQVLQRGQPIRIWGWGPPGSSITGMFTNNGPQSGLIDADGFWKLTWPSLLASIQPKTINVTIDATGQSISLSDVLIGDVFLCSGQSNMEYTVNDVVNATAEIEAANGYPLIRITSGPLQGKFNLSGLNTQTLQDELQAVDLPW